MSLEIFSVVSVSRAFTVAVRGTSHRMAISPTKPFFCSSATRICPPGVSISTSATPPRITYMASPGSPWWQSSWSAEKTIRSLVKASSLSLAGSILAKIGTPLRSSTSSLRFIASSCLPPRRLRRLHQIAIEHVRRQLRRAALGDHPTGLHHHHPVERLDLGRPVGDPQYAPAVPG